MKSWKPLAGIAVVLALTATGIAEAAGGSSAPPVPAPPSPSEPQSKEAAASDAYHQGLKHRDKAWKLEDKAASADSDAERAKLLAKARKQYEKAILLFKDATDGVATFHQAWSSLGYALRKTGDYDGSLEAYDRALAIEPGYAEAIEYRAEAYLGLDRVEDAKAAYVQLFSLDRARADELMAAMEEWVAMRRADPGGVASETVEAFAAWVAERGEIADQTARLSAAADRPWGD